MVGWSAKKKPFTRIKMDQSLPNSDCESEVSGYSDPNCYVIRMTPMERYSVEDLKKYLTEMDCVSWILSVEELPKMHYHLVIEHEDELSDMKLRIRSFLDTYWPPGQRGRGFGNAQYNCQIAEDKDKSISYLLKDGGAYYFDGYSQEYIDECLSKSFQKKSPSSFKVEYQKLCEQFESTESMDIDDFMISFINLKAKYGQMVRVHDAYGYALSNLCKRDPTVSQDLVKDFLRKL